MFNPSVTILSKLSVHDQKTIIFALLRILSTRLVSSSKEQAEDPSTVWIAHVVGGIAALLLGYIAALPQIYDYLVEWLVGVSAAATAYGYNTYRAVIVCLASAEGLQVETSI